MPERRNKDLLNECQVAGRACADAGAVGEGGERRDEAIIGRALVEAAIF